MEVVEGIAQEIHPQNMALCCPSSVSTHCSMGCVSIALGVNKLLKEHSDLKVVTQNYCHASGPALAARVYNARAAASTSWEVLKLKVNCRYIMLQRI